MLVQFRRHSIKDGATPHTIGAQGFELARTVGRLQLRGRGFNHYAISELWRTGQTFAGLDEGAGDFNLKRAPLIAPFNLRDKRALAIFSGIRPADQAGEDLFQAARNLDNPTVEFMAAKLARTFRHWIKRFKPGDRILVINHSPSSEILAYGLTGTTMPSLRECEGFELALDGKEFQLRYGSAELDSTVAFAAMQPKVTVDERRSFLSILRSQPQS